MPGSLDAVDSSGNKFMCLPLSWLQELLDLVANSGSMAPSELAQRKEDLKRKQKRQLVDFDTLTKQVQ